MRILHVAYSLGDSSAATRLALSQADAHDVLFATCRRSDTAFVERRRVGTAGFFFAGIVLHVFEILVGRLLRIRRDEVVSFGLCARLPAWLLRRAIRRHAIDVVHLHWGGYGFMPLAALDRLPVPAVITAHDYQYFTGGCHVPMADSNCSNACRECPLAGSRTGKWLLHRNMRATTRRWQSSRIRIIAPSNYTANVIRSLHPLTQVSVVPNTFGPSYPHPSAISAPSAAPGPDQLDPSLPTIVTVGVSSSIRDNKGVGTLTFTLERLRAAKKPFNLICVGEDVGPLAPKRYLHVPFLDAASLATLYAVADLCLVPSKFETFSQVTMEAILVGTPVVAFDRSGPRDIIVEGKTGFLIPSFDDAAFARCVINNLHFKQANEAALAEGSRRARATYAGPAIRSLVDAILDELAGSEASDVEPKVETA